MELLDSLFRIESEHHENGRHYYTVGLYPEHFIYKAHFPGEPITPGVCIMQMALELLEKACGMRLSLECARNIKFLKVISPEETPVLNYCFEENVMEDGTVRSTINVLSKEETYAKISLICTAKE